MSFVFIKKQDPDNRFDTSKVMVKSEAIVLSDLLQDIKCFLLASGFVFTGELEIVEEVSYESGTEDET